MKRSEHDTNSGLCLVTGCNRKYFISAVNLIESFWRHHPGQPVRFFWFDVPRDWLDWLQGWKRGLITVEEVPRTLSHAHEATMFYWKTWLLKEVAATARVNQRFIYLDAGTEVKAPLDFVGKWLRERDYLFFVLPNKIGDWTSKLCLQKLGAHSADYAEANQIHANFIGFRASERVKTLLAEWEKLMRDIEIAGPAAGIERPDGLQARCVAHRSDQSVLSVLLNKHRLSERPDAHESERHVDWRAVPAQVVLCHRMQDRTASMRYSTWAHLLYTGVIPSHSTVSSFPVVCTLRSPLQSCAWYARNQGKWGVRRRLRLLRNRK